MKMHEKENELSELKRTLEICIWLSAGSIVLSVMALMLAFMAIIHE
jgi:hypothetical protein